MAASAHLKKVLKIASGLFLIMIGLIGLVMPIMPGWAFIIPGLLILAEYFPAVRRLVDWAKAQIEKRNPIGSGKPDRADS